MTTMCECVRGREMEESQEILLNSLESSGVPIPTDVSSIEDLTPETLVSICAHSLRVISNSDSFPITLPDSMADRFKICTDLASSVKDLGYIGDISFHQFLYPSEEQMYKLIRFLVGRLSESSKTAVSADNENNDDGPMVNTECSMSNPEERTKNIINEKEALEVCARVGDLNVETGEALSNSVPHSKEETVADENQGGSQETSNAGSTIFENGGVLEEDSSEMNCKIEKLRHQENLLSEEATAKSLELQQLEEQHDLLKASVEMACNKQNSVVTYIKQLNEQVEARRRSITNLESKWDATIKPLEEKRRSLEESLCSAKPECEGKFLKLKKVELEIESILCETKERDEELAKLSTEIDKLPKSASRRSYIERIKETTKNSRKLDIDIERILKETRELQLESNSIQERLHRTYAVVDETVLREAKKDEAGQQAHRLLTRIHESFTETSEKILATDRTRREATDLEAKLSGIASRSLNIDKLQADLDAIRKENEFLQSRLDNP